MLTNERAEREWRRLAAPLAAFAIVDGHFEAVDLVRADASQIGAVRVVVYHCVLAVLTSARRRSRRSRRGVLERAIGSAEHSRRLDHKLAIAIEQTLVEALELTRAIHLTIGSVNYVILDARYLRRPFELRGPVIGGHKYFVSG